MTAWDRARAAVPMTTRWTSGPPRFLSERGHNFIRLWRWEQFRSQAAGGNYHLDMSPQPWARTGPGTAGDGKPRFDLDRFDDEFFNRLRERVATAGEAGFYVGVMLFDGWALHLSPPPDHVEGHPWHLANNVNGIAAASINDLQVLPLDPRIAALQEAYMRKVVDTLHDLPNVLWEVANESSGDGSVTQEFADFLGMDEAPVWGDSTDWQYWVIDVVKRHETERGYDVHPIGMTMQFPVAEQTKVNEPLLRSRAEWISPGYDDEIFAHGGHPMAPGSAPSRWFADPPDRGRRQGGHQRHRPLRTRSWRRVVGLEDVPARPPPHPDGLRADRRPRTDRRGLRRHRRAPVRVLRARAVGHGRHPPARRAYRPGRHASRTAASRPPATRWRTPASSTSCWIRTATAGRSRSTSSPAPTGSNGST